MKATSDTLVAFLFGVDAALLRVAGFLKKTEERSIVLFHQRLRLGSAAD